MRSPAARRSRLASSACMAGSSRLRSASCRARHSASVRANMPVGRQLLAAPQNALHRRRGRAELRRHARDVQRQVACLVEPGEQRDGDHPIRRRRGEGHVDLALQELGEAFGRGEVLVGAELVPVDARPAAARRGRVGIARVGAHLLGKRVARLGVDVGDGVGFRRGSVVIGSRRRCALPARPARAAGSARPRR